MSTLVRIHSVGVIDGFSVRLEFTDGSARTVDLDPYLRGPVFEPLRSDPELFRAVRVDHELGTIVWPNGADICPDVLHGSQFPEAWEAETPARSG